MHPRGEAFAGRDLALAALLALAIHALGFLVPFSTLQKPGPPPLKGPLTLVLGLEKPAARAGPSPAVPAPEPKPPAVKKPVQKSPPRAVLPKSQPKPEPEPRPIESAAETPAPERQTAPSPVETPAPAPVQAAAPSLEPQAESGAGSPFATGEMGPAKEESAAEGPAAGTVPEQPGQGGTDTSVARPDYLVNPRPRYPASARRRGHQGTVVLAVTVSSEGRPTRVEVAASSGHGSLDEAALNAVREWAFIPARRGTRPVASRVEVPVTFRLSR